MKSYLVRPLLFLVFASAASIPAIGQTPSSAAPHLVRILLDSAAARQFRPGFAAIRSGQPDIQEISLNDSSAIESVLNLPHVFHIVSLKPYLPEHSVVFEDIREHINPSLFQKSGDQALSIGQSGPVSDNLSLLRTSEERLSRWFILRYSDSISPETAARLCRKSYEIENAEPLYPATPQYVPDTPNDPLIPQQYSLPMINAFNAWGVVRCDSAMVVADVDVGVDLTQQDLGGAVWNNPGETGTDAQGRPKNSNMIDDDSDGFVDDWRGWDFAGVTDNLGFPDNDPSIDPKTGNTHGTVTSGLLAATANNGVGIAGVAFGAKFIPVKTCSDDNTGEVMFYVFPGIVYAADHGARVINCSIGEDYQSASDEDVINYAYAKGSVVAVAAGNGQKYFDEYPASYRNSFSVTAVGEARETAGYNYNRNVSVAAPGVNVMTTWPDNKYNTNSGTSLACPQAAGGIAMVDQSAIDGPLHEKYPNITPGQAMAQLRATTSPIVNDPFPGFDGTGIIDLDSAVTDTSAHALRVESVDILNGESDSTLLPGQHATLHIHFKNYLSPLVNVNAAIELLDSNGVQYDPSTGIVHSSVSSLALGAFETLGVSEADLPIVVDAAAPPNSWMLIKLIFRDSEADYTYNDYDYIKLTVNPPFRTLDTNDIFVSIYNNGAIGHILPSDGDGFGWGPAPKAIYSGNRDLLFDGGLMIAADTNRIAESMGFISHNQSQFSYGPLLRQAISEPFPGGKVAASFTATLADSAESSSVIVDENAIEFTDPAAADAMILDYFLHGAQNLNIVNAGIYMDWDLGDGGFSNYASFGDSSGITINDSVFIIYRLNQNYPVIAMKVIARPLQSALNYYALNKAIELNGGDPDMADEWRMLTTKKALATYNDVAVELGARNISIPLGGTHLTYAIGLGTSEDSARAALERATALFNGTASVSTLSAQNGSASASIDIWPDPAEREMNISIPSITAGQIVNLKITDALGRKIAESAIPNGGEISIDNMPSGIYFIEANCQNSRFLRTFVKE